LATAQKKARVDWCTEMLKKYSHGTSKVVYKIVTVDESWIYAYDLESKQQSIVWVFQGEPNSTKIVHARSSSKQKVACFFGITGHVTTVLLEQCRAVNSEWYTTICLPKVFGEIRKKPAENGPFSTTTMRALTHRLRQLPILPGEYRIDWSICHTALIWHQ